MHEADWPAIAQLASNAIQQADHLGIDHLWVESRRSFDGFRKQAVVESDGSLVGYCAIERAADEPLNTYRVFLVAAWDRTNSLVHDALFARAEAMLREVGATRAWMRELTGDLELLQFVEQRGFASSALYTVAGKEMVNLTKLYAPPTRV